MTSQLSQLVIAGLDPAIHPSSQEFFQMDARVKPAHDMGNDMEIAR